MQAQAVLLDQPRAPERAWQCPKCGNIPPLTQNQYQDGTVLIQPQSLITQLSNDPGAIYICLVCITRWQRETFGCLVEFDPAIGPPIKAGDLPQKPPPTPINRAQRRGKRR